MPFRKYGQTFSQPRTTLLVKLCTRTTFETNLTWHLGKETASRSTCLVLLSEDLRHPGDDGVGVLGSHDLVLLLLPRRQGLRPRRHLSHLAIVTPMCRSELPFVGMFRTAKGHDPPDLMRLMQSHAL